MRLREEAGKDFMESDKLYQVQPEDLPKLEELLTKCFSCDPLYEELIAEASDAGTVCL